MELMYNDIIIKIYVDSKKESVEVIVLIDEKQISHGVFDSINDIDIKKILLSSNIKP